MIGRKTSMTYHAHPAQLRGSQFVSAGIRPRGNRTRAAVRPSLLMRLRFGRTVEDAAFFISFEFIMFPTCEDMKPFVQGLRDWSLAIPFTTRYFCSHRCRLFIITRWVYNII
jgi:hypothetical protein